MKLFKIEQKQSNSGWIDANHRWNLPGVDCPACKSAWGTTGLEYPSIDLTGLGEEVFYREARCEPLTKYLYLRKKIAESFPELPLLMPGTTFGSLVGIAISNYLEGFVWRAWWTICLEAEALSKLNESNLSLPVMVKADLSLTESTKEVFEFNLPLTGRLSNPVYDGIQPDYCSACGRDSGTLPDEIQVDRSSLSNDFDIFRLTNFTTIILATERFVEAVNSQQIKGAVFREVKIV